MKNINKEKSQLGRSSYHQIVTSTTPKKVNTAWEEHNGSRDWPVTMAVRWLASTPSVTCSAVEADPNPLGPGLPVINEKIPMKSGVSVLVAEEEGEAKVKKEGRSVGGTQIKAEAEGRWGRQAKVKKTWEFKAGLWGRDGAGKSNLVGLVLHG